MKRICLKPLLIILLFSSLAGTLQAQTTYYVKEGGTGDGSSWANASGNLQLMMNAAANGGTVLVAGGTYYPTTSLDKDISFLLPKAGGVRLIGGYNAATGTRDIAGNPTILSGDIGAITYLDDNSYHVLVIANTDVGADSIIIDGFTVTKGQATGLGEFVDYNGTTIRNHSGAGICVVLGGKVAIRNTVITGNEAIFSAGGMYNDRSSLLIENCSVTSNRSLSTSQTNLYQYAGGGGIYNDDSAPIIRNTTIKSNQSPRGAGIFNKGNSAKFDNCLFESNIAFSTGGAINNYGGASPVFNYCVFTGNESLSGGVGYDNNDAFPTYNNCIFYNNKATGTGGGNGYGGCFFGFKNRYLFLHNCVLTGNSSSEGNSIRLLDGALRMYNTIIYGNTGGTDIYVGGLANSTQIGYSLYNVFEKGEDIIATDLGGNLTGTYDPLFVNPANPAGPDGIWGTSDDGLQLQLTSPVINAGNNSMIPSGSIPTDMTGAPRIQGGTVEMGPYESAHILNCSFSTLYVDGNRSGSGAGGSWSTAFKTLSEAMERARYCNNVNTILVAKGTYYPTGVQNGIDRDSTFLIPQRGGIKIYGGYPNGGGTRNPNANPTILSGDIGASGNNSDNSYHILVMTETLPGADSIVVDGFTFTNANANGSQYYYNNTLTNQDEGGAILFRKNSNAGTKIAIRNCNILNNNAATFGGGIYLWESSTLINNCVIANNTATEGGAGLFNLGTASSALINCALSGNSSKNGAAVYNNVASLTITNNTFTGNTASVQGGGIYTIGASNITAVNTILWNNGGNNIYNSGTLNITYSNIEQGSGVYSGTGNINADPLFINSANPAGQDGVWRTSDDGLKLQGGSASVNAGTPDASALSLNPYDLQDNERILAGGIDMGAYESPYVRCNEITNVLYVDGSVSQSGNGSSWSSALKTLTEALDALPSCAGINTILVAKGTYYPTTSSNRDAAFLTPRRGNIKIYGGYPIGGGTRDLAANHVILSGDIGAIGNNADNSYHVMVIANTDAGADSIIIDGFTFTNANADGSGLNTLNEALVARNTGGGLSLASNNGNAKITIRNCRFVNNRANQGGGVYNIGSSPFIINSYLQGNSSSDNGGGMSNYGNAAPTLINVLITGNYAGNGGAVFNDNSSPAFINATIADNYALNIGGLYNRYNGTNVTFRNSIIYGNRIPDGSPSNIFNTSSGKANFSYSLIENAAGTWDPAFGTSNGNNLFTDPQFVSRVDPTGGNTPNTSGNYQLQSASPVVDAGSNALLPTDINTDIVGAVRTQQAATDMGAFESPYFDCDRFIVTATQANVKCYGDATGIASIVINQGVAPYTYSWSNGAQTASINNIIAGDYTCVVTDANGCSMTKEFTITQPAAALSAVTSFNNINCFGANNGSAAIIVSGGTTPYAYNWSNGSTTANITALSPGTYSCTVTDANGCSVIKAVTLTQPAATLSAATSQTDIACFNTNTGSASVTASGGTAPYTYNWSNGETTTAINNLATGNYTCTITDANGCSLVKTFTIIQPAATLSATTSQTDIACFNANTGSASVTTSGGTTPYTYNWSNGGTTAAINNLAPGNYTCTITDANGCSVVKTFTIIQPAAALSATTSQTDILCFNSNTGAATVTVTGGTIPYTYNWNNGGSTPTISNLTAGNYSCTITDANGCSVVKTFTITQPADALSAATSQTNISCFNANNGSTTVVISGGTAPYQYNWSNGGSTASINNLSPGNYTCTITDANGCTISETFTITQPGELKGQIISQTNVFCNSGNTGMAVIEATGGVTPYTYQWSNGSSTATANGLAAGNYSCLITDANGCMVNTPVTITQQSIAGNKLFVDGAVAVSGNGSSWTSAFKYLSDALNAASACNGIDSILVAKGTYYPEGTPGSNRDTTFLIRQSGGLKIYGGYPTGGGLRNVDLNTTVLSGEMGSGSIEDNNYHVMVIAGISAAADSIVIDGFTIQQGFANKNGGYNYNGITISGNNGGGICLYNNNDAAGKILIRNCNFTDHVAFEMGAAIYNQQSSPVIEHCKFSGGVALFRGGAIANENSSSPIISYCEFTNNEGGSGGAISNIQNSDARISQSRFTGNFCSAMGGGGAILNESSSPLITSCFIAGNKSLYNDGGGGVYNKNATTTIMNSIFAGNLAQSTNGGGMANLNNSAVTVTNCTFYANTANYGSGSIWNSQSQLQITNSILLGTGAEIRTINGATTSVNYSLVQGWSGGGTGNLNSSLDPMFVAPAAFAPFTNADFRLKACSPAINTGTIDTTGLNLPSSEMTGLPRVQLGRIDLGANEANSYANQNAGTIPTTVTSATAYQLKDGTTWYATDCTTLIAAVKGSGGNPVNGNTTATVDKDDNLLPGAVSRYYEITPDNNPSTSSGTITLYFTQAEFDAYNTANNGNQIPPFPDKDDADMNDKIANIRIRKVSGATATIITPQTVSWNGVAERWEISFEVSSFSKFYVFTEKPISLPLRLLNFTAKEKNCIADVSWTTAGETGVSHFEVEQSTDGILWSISSKTAAGNTGGETNYHANASITASVNYYRLKMVDMDGTTTYSKVVQLVSPPNCIRQIIKLYPNPAAGIVYIEKAGAGDVYGVYDNNGRKVLQGNVSKTVQDIVIKDLAAGMYSIIIINAKGEMQSLKFIKTR